MEIDPGKASTIRRAVLSIVLAGISVALAVAVSFAAGKVPGAAETVRKGFYYLAWTCLVLLALSLTALVWTVAHLLAGRSKPTAHHARTHYVDAWALAGKRFKLKKGEEGDEDEQDDSPEDDSDDEGQDGTK